MCELVYRGVGASPQTRIVLFEHCVCFFKDELHIHFWSTKQVLKMFILPRMLTLLNIKYPKSRMCCQNVVNIFHFGTAQLCVKKWRSTKTKTNTKTMTNTFKEHLQRAILEIFGL